MNPSFTNWIINQSLQIAILALLVGVVGFFMRKRFPHLIGTLWLLVLIKAITPPLWQSPISLASAVQTNRAHYQQESGFEANAGRIKRVFAADPAFRGLATVDGQPIQLPTVSKRNHFSWSNFIVGIYFAGILFLSAKLLMQWRRLSRLIHSRRLPTPRHLELQVQELSATLGVSARYNLVIVDAPLGAAVFGFRRPTILLSKTVAETCNTGELSTVLCHELIHLRRRDHLLSWLQTGCRLVWWFHPGVWWAARQVERFSEFCCDEEVVASTRMEPAEYGKQLINLARQQSLLPVPAGTLGFGGPSVLKLRLLQLLTPAKRFCARAPLWCRLMGLLLALCILPGAALDSEQKLDDYDKLVRAYYKDIAAFLSNRDVADHSRHVTGDENVSADLVERYIPRFLAAAKANPNSPAADECLWWVMKYSPSALPKIDAVANFVKKYPEAQQYLKLTRQYDPMNGSQELKQSSEFLAIAEAHPTAPVSFDALLLLIGNYEYGTNVDKMLQLFRQHHTQSPYLAREHLFGRAPGVVEYRKVNFFGYFSDIDTSAQGEQILRSILKNNPSREVRLKAQLCLAERLMNQATMAERVQSSSAELRNRNDPKFVSHYMAIDAKAARVQAQELLKGLLETGDVPYGVKNTTISEAAKKLLFADEHVRIGQLAPDIQGVDADGHSFKLSDYNGQVRLVVFSGTWCSGCRELYPKGHQLLKDYKGKPFVLLAVNADDAGAVKKSVKSGDIAWRCWVDGQSGPICKQWNIEAFPTAYLIDHKGIIRKEGTQILADTLDKSVAELVAEVKP